VTAHGSRRRGAADHLALGTERTSIIGWDGEGLDLHERPFIEQGDTMTLQPGMVFSVEPGVYVPGVGGARVEETVLVTETGREVISDMGHRELSI
jgi:Xaa-Pro aminopeptidase